MGGEGGDSKQGSILALYERHKKRVKLIVQKKEKKRRKKHKESTAKLLM